MDPTRRARRPLVEPLEAKALLASATPAAPVETTAALVTTATGQTVALSGTLHGRYTETLQNPDLPRQFHLTGAGFVRPLGHASVTGAFHTVGLIANGHAGGTIVLSGVRGSLTLTLSGPTQSGPAPLPGTFHFEISGGTGAFRGAQGGGTALLGITPAHGKVPGTFTLSLGKGAASTGQP